MGNFDQISELLKKYQFEKNPQLKSNLIRRICQQIAVNRCHGDCGCNFFFKFMENFIPADNKLFPTDCSDCKWFKIIFNLNVFDDNHIDIVENSLIKYPFKSHNCDTESEIMSDNGNICIQFLLVYSVAEFGCTTSNMRGESVIDRLIGGIRQRKFIVNELMVSRCSQSQEYLKEYLPLISSSQSLLLNYIKIVFNLNALKNEVHELKQRISDIMNETIRMIFHLKEELDKIIMDIENINNELIVENQEIKKENIKLKKQIKDSNLIKMGDGNTIDHFDREIPDVNLWTSPMKPFRSFCFCFNNISHLKTKWAVDSDKFLSNDGQYEIILQLWPRGCSHGHQDSHVCMELSISSLVDSLSVPSLKCRVKLCLGSHSTINVEKYLMFFDDSTVRGLPQFHFHKSDLNRSGVIEIDSLKISCEIFID